METLISSTFTPAIAVISCPKSEFIIPEITTNSSNQSPPPPARIFPLKDYASINQTEPSELDVQALITQNSFKDNQKIYHFMQQLVQKTFEPSRSCKFETFGHPIACIIIVKESNASVIGKFTELYQETFKYLPKEINSEFLRCFVCLSDDDNNQDGDGGHGENGSENGSENGKFYSDVVTQFGPHCYKTAASGIKETIDEILERSVYPYLNNVIENWQESSQRSSTSGFGFGKFLKKLVQNSPPKPEYDVFWEVGREMQPHVALIPSQRSRILDVDAQLRRLADVAFMLGKFDTAFMTYDYLRKPFTSEQRWDMLAGVCEMASLSYALTNNIRANMNYIAPVVDNALYTYFSRLGLPAHSLRCVFLVSGVLNEYGHQLLAAGLLSTTLIELDPVPLGCNKPAETAILMDYINYTFESYGWKRKALLWSKLADLEWRRVNKTTSSV